MKISALPINGAFQIEQEPINDTRGSFARQFCKKELAAAGIAFDIKQCNMSKNTHAGTLRGMHYQKEPYPEIKMVSCLSGSMFDVILDLRKDSPTYLKWSAITLNGLDGHAIYIPAGVAHGFQTLEDNTTVFYQLGEFFMPEFYAGVRWNDSIFGIIWPECNQRIISDRDNNYVDWRI